METINVPATTTTHNVAAVLEALATEQLEAGNDGLATELDALAAALRGDDVAASTVHQAAADLREHHQPVEHDPAMTRLAALHLATRCLERACEARDRAAGAAA